ncbi:hypothetical protein OY671_004377 [Metschnikowia pulcherrima]|nr:hypothetical protein OY671_004377 [Metschnikowia pulcherrima]
MSQKADLDDFASLFLPDLLNRVDSFPQDPDPKPAAGSRAPLLQVSPVPSTSSSGMSLIRYFEASQANQAVGQDSAAVSSAFSDLNQYLQSPGPAKFGEHSFSGFPGAETARSGASGAGQGRNEASVDQRNAFTGYASNMSASAPNMSGHGLSPFSNLDMGHTSHYADFLPPEASYAPSQRQRQFMYHQGYPSGSHTQFEGGGWPGTDASSVQGKNYYTPQMYYSGLVPGMEVYPSDPYSGARAAKEPEIAVDSVPTIDISEKVDKRGRPMNTTQISVDYSGPALDRLVDLKRTTENGCVAVYAGSGAPVTFSLQGFLHGRLLSNDQDNHNYIQSSAGSVDPAQIYQPQVISCYRRNFINLHLHLAADDIPAQMLIEGLLVTRFRVEITAITDKSSPEPVALLDNEHEPEPRRAGDHVSVETIGPSHVIEPSNMLKSAFWRVKKLQFKSATANSTNLAFQTYYRFLVRLYAETASGDHVVDELVSNPIIVRGRNPSFYQQKNDVLIKAKSPNAMASYSHSAQALPLLRERLTSHSKTSLEPIVSTESGSLSAENPPVKSEAGSPEPVKIERPEKKADSDEESASEDETGSQVKKPTSDLRVANAAGPVDLQTILAGLSKKKGDKYHYFPISNVYYLPPINVVYFPHAAHHTDADADRDGEAKTDVGAHTPASQTGSDRKPSSKVYFK